MLRKISKAIKIVLGYLGIYPDQFFTNFRSWGWFVKDYLRLRHQLKKDNQAFGFGIPMPVLNEKFAESGRMSGHYFHQDLLIAQKIFKNNPERHVDIGSRIDGFVTHVASFREIEVFDIREANVTIKNIKFRQANFMHISDELAAYADSVSCLHVIEHFGLGRYNDPIDAEGHIKGLENIYKLLKRGGKFYFSTPIGPQRINFNAHRVFSISYLLSLFDGKYKIDSFSYVNDPGILVENARLSEEGVKSNFGCKFGCGIFEMTKL